MPVMTPFLLSLAAASIQLVSAHGYVKQWDVDDAFFNGFTQQSQTDPNQLEKVIAWSDTASDSGYVGPSAYSTADIICHKNAKNGQLVNATVHAGGTVKATWNTWPDSHHGPIIDYIAAAEDPATVDKASLKWVKIQQKGVVSGSNPGKWATDEMVSNGLSHSITIPAGLKPGSYVLRTEIIALHSANNEGGAQNYPQCANIKVTGSGTQPMPEGTVGTALYKSSDPGIHFDLYQSFSSYSFPGPALASVTGESSAGSDSCSRSHSRDLKK